MIFLNNLNKIFMSKDYPDGQGVSVSASASDSEGSYDGSNSNSGDDKKDSSVISCNVVRPAPSKEPNPLIVEELREDNAEYLKKFITQEKEIGGANSNFTRFVPGSRLGEVNAGDSKAGQKRKKSESPAAKDPADVPGDVGGRDTDFTRFVRGSGLGAVNAGDSKVASDKVGQKRKKSESPAAKDPADCFRAVRGSNSSLNAGGSYSGGLLVNKSTQTTPYQGNSPTEKLVPAPAPLSPGQGGVGKEKGLSPS